MPDLVFTDDDPTEIETRAVDTVVRAGGGPVTVYESERFVRGGRQRRHERRHLLLPALHALQAEVGFVSPGGLNYVCRQLEVPPAEAYGVATFYHLLSLEDPGGDVVHVCDDIACRNSAGRRIEQLRAAGHTVKASPCLGQCEREAPVFIQRIGQPDADRFPDDPPAAAPVPQAGEPGLKLLQRIGVADPEHLESYRNHDGYEALSQAIQMGAEAILDAVSDAGLMGRGGAAFPTGRKWRGVAGQATTERHVVANADESEPGTFKDRVVMEHDPFALIESLTIAGFATGAEHGWIYLRGEYPIARERLENAIRQARAAGLLGENVMGAGFAFDIELRIGGGAYICGEETALFNSIEGFRGEPRSKPPFPTEQGLFSEPTVVNNVETLINVLPIIRDGAAAFAAIGAQRSTGPKLFCLSGAVSVPGIYEVEYGATLREVLELAGGATGPIRTILLGGAAGSFVGPDQLDLPLTLEATQEAGTTLGSGVVMVFAEGADMVDIVTRIAAFFRDESCGQCVPCRVGTVRQEETLVRLRSAEDRNRDLALLADLDAVMTDASICGLGQTAASAIRSARALGLLDGSMR